MAFVHCFSVGVQSLTLTAHRTMCVLDQTSPLIAFCMAESTTTTFIPSMELFFNYFVKKSRQFVGSTSSRYQGFSVCAIQMNLFRNVIFSNVRSSLVNGQGPTTIRLYILFGKDYIHVFSFRIFVYMFCYVKKMQYLVKVSESRKQILKFSFEQKCISALAL